MFVKGYNINNIDVTICLQDPKINQYILKMKDCLSKILEVENSQLSLKATTTEKLGFVGRGEGVSCYSVVLIKKM